MSNSTLGTAVRELRKARRWKQSDLATKMRCTQGFVSDLETGKCTWTEPLIRAAAHALGITPGALIDLSDTVQAPSAAA